MLHECTLYELLITLGCMLPGGIAATVQLLSVRHCNDSTVPEQQQRVASATAFAFAFCKPLKGCASLPLPAAATFLCISCVTAHAMLDEPLQSYQAFKPNDLS